MIWHIFWKNSEIKPPSYGRHIFSLRATLVDSCDLCMSNNLNLFFFSLAIAALGDEEQLAMAVGQQLARMQQPVKVIHKEHEAVTAFCINKVSR